MYYVYIQKGLEIERVKTENFNNLDHVVQQSGSCRSTIWIMSFNDLDHVVQQSGSCRSGTRGGSKNKVHQQSLFGEMELIK